LQFGVLPPVRSGATTDPAWMAAFARTAEGLGFESIVLVEHAVIVSDYRSRYPYSSSGRMPLPDDCAIPDPLDAMAYLAAVTDRITLATGVLVAPNHQPVVLAKRIATVDVLSGGRVRMCLGVGWMEEEVRAAGADPRSRGRRTDETITAMRALWADSGPDGAEFHGEFVSFDHAHSFPKPVRGDVPVHIGGHSEAAARRAGRLGDGFQPLGIAGELLAERMDTVRRSAEEAGRDPAAIELSVSGYLPATTDDEVDAAERAGAVRMVVATSVTPDLDALGEELSAFAVRFGITSEAPASASATTAD
jgi:probable F420-dependent oxidoreductase